MSETQTAAKFIAEIRQVTSFPRSTIVRVIETRGQDTMQLWMDNFPPINEAAVRLFLDHAGWKAVGEVTETRHGWTQVVVPVTGQM
jgi:hypothetical protein